MKEYENGRVMTDKNRNGYFWNAAAGILNAGEAVILSMVVTRTNGLADAGVLSMAFAVGNLMMTIGKYGVRSYQVTDVDERFSFSAYFWTRVLTVVFMAVTSLVYIWYCVYAKGYSGQKAAVILSFCFIYMVESMEDVFWGFYQQKQALDIGAKIFILRWTVILGVCILVLIRFRHLSLASLIGAIVSLVVFEIANRIFFRDFQEKIVCVKLESMRQILAQCFPLFLSAFMTIYVTNAPKYAIDRYLSEEVQACYGFIAMPVFLIELLSNFLYQPSLVHMALEWKECRIGSFRRRIRKQCAVLLSLTAVCLWGAYLYGIPILSVLYGTELGGYKAELLVLLCGGGFLSYAGYFSVLLTILRKQKVVMYGYAVIYAFALMFSNFFVKAYGVPGAAVFYTLLMMVLAIVFAFVCARSVRAAIK